MFTGKALVDEQIFLVMAHRVSEVDVFHLPAVPLKLMAHHPVEVLFVHSIVAAQGGTVVIIDDHFGFVMDVIAAEVVNQSRYLALELRVEALDDVQTATARLARHYPVDVGVVVHADADGRKRIQVLIRTAVELCLVELVAQAIEIIEVAGIILVALTHRRVKAVFGNAYALTKNRGLERLGREVTFHLFDVRLAKQL